MKTVLKRALCGITAFVIAAGAMSYFPADTFPEIARGATAYAETDTITAADLKTIAGNGEQESPYVIKTAEELFAVMSVGNTYYAILNNDIVINEGLLNSIDKETGEPKSDSIVRWTPIGTEKYYFNGNFNGNGHTISGLYVDGGDYAGLFGKTQGCPEIKGVGIVDSYFKGTNVGGIAGALIDVNGAEYDFIAGCFTYNVKLEGTNSDKFVGSVSGNGYGRLNSSYCLADNEETLSGINCSAMTAKGF